jgi:hypothetical protein
MHQNTNAEAARSPGAQSEQPQGAPDAGLGERERQVREDYEWCLRDGGVQRAHAGKVVAVHRRTVWGVADNHEQAVAEALRREGCPPRESLAVVFIEGRALGAGA